LLTPTLQRKVVGPVPALAPSSSRAAALIRRNSMVITDC
jgi:hypothetical protein